MTHFLLLALLVAPLTIAETDPVVQVGADRLFDEFGHLIEGRRVALVANHSATLADGRHLADALHGHPDVDLVAIFGMSFDVRTNDYSLPRETGATTDEPTGVPKYSLYADQHKPTADQLQGAEVVIVDIQDVGARFYEHINILGFAMEAAAELGLEVVVLDRPNPLTGELIEGFVTDPEFFYTFGAYGPVPVLHGMTMGEIAQLYNGERMLRGGGQASLHVVEMLGWRRSMWLDETGLPWSRPSPNLPTLSSVIAYAGTCLFEGLNLSEGRGTERPFEYIGAIWLDNESVAGLLNELELPGVSFEAIRFSPRREAFHGSDPYLTGEDVRGVAVNVYDRDRFQPYRTGIAMVWAVNRLHSDKLEWNERTMLRLTSTRRVMEMLRAGEPPDVIAAAWQDDVNAFRETRASYLLYE
jgi:uncharacterized protein YbbC (DUF1343 family)